MSLFSLLGSMFSFGFNMIFVVIPALVIYVIEALAYYKLLTRMDYTNAWMAWIPYLNYFALADCVCYSDYINIIGQEINTKLFRFWFIVSAILGCIPYVGSMLAFIIQTLCLGYCFTEIFASLEHKMTDETKLIGHLSGAFPIIGVIKSYMIK